MKNIFITNKDFDYLVNKVINNVGRTLVTKGDDYSGSEDNRLANFDRGASALHCSVEQYLLGLVYKHIDNVFQSFTNEGHANKTTVEDTKDRIQDIIVYFTILWAAVEHNEGLENAKDINFVGQSERENVGTSL